MVEQSNLPEDPKDTGVGEALSPEAPEVYPSTQGAPEALTPQEVNSSPAALPWWVKESTAIPLSTKVASRYKLKSRLVSLGVVGVILAGFATVLIGFDTPATQSTVFGGTETRQTTQALIGGCGGTFDFPNPPGDIGTVPTPLPGAKPPRVNYATGIPMWGVFYDIPAPVETHFYSVDAVNIPRPEILLNNMWHGTMVVYYGKKADPNDIISLQQLAEQRPDLNLIVAPWIRSSPLPANRNISYVVWGASQSCQRIVAAGLQEFRNNHPASAAPGADGSTPPVAPPRKTATPKPPVSATVTTPTATP